MALHVQTARSAVTDRRYRRSFKASIDLMNGLLYKCGGDWGIPASDKVLPRIYIVRDLADSTGSASKIHSI